MSTTTQLTPEELAARKAQSAIQQSAGMAAVTESDAALHKLADELHNSAFADEKVNPKPSFADSLRAAATRLIAQARQNPKFPPAALDYFLRYAPDAPAAGVSAPDADPIAEAELAAEETNA